MTTTLKVGVFHTLKKVKKFLAINFKLVFKSSNIFIKVGTYKLLRVKNSGILIENKNVSDFWVLCGDVRERGASA